MKPGRILALDYGPRWTGLAISDREGTVALPLRVVDARRENLLETIRRVVEEYGIQRIVLGLPLTEKGEAGEAAQRVLAFKEQLEQALGLPVDLVDERWTTLEAEARLKTAGYRHLKRTGKTDAVAAQILLEAYLARRSRFQRPDPAS